MRDVVILPIVHPKISPHHGSLFVPLSVPQSIPVARMLRTRLDRERANGPLANHTAASLRGFRPRLYSDERGRLNH